jgi:hypothetical protein
MAEGQPELKRRVENAKLKMCAALFTAAPFTALVTAPAGVNGHHFRTRHFSIFSMPAML